MCHTCYGTARQEYSRAEHLSRGTGGRWSDRAKAAYKSWRDYIIAVKGKMRHRVTTGRVGGISANLVDFVEWRIVVWRAKIARVQRIISTQLNLNSIHLPFDSTKSNLSWRCQAPSTSSRLPPRRPMPNTTTPSSRRSRLTRSGTSPLITLPKP